LFSNGGDLQCIDKSSVALSAGMGAVPLGAISAIGSKVLGKFVSTGTRTKKVEPIKNADGAHTTWKTDPQTGKITRHETWTPNARNPRGFDKVQSTDIKGVPHINKRTGEAIQTPHTQGKNIPGGVRPARPDEIPRQ